MKNSLLALALTTVASGAMAQEVGLKLVEYQLPHHDDTVRGAIWYPGTGGSPTLYADNPVFLGAEASMDAEIAPGMHPLVLFSHGMGGTDRAQAWLGSELARRGAIVLMINHPNSTWGDFDMSKGVRHWTRAMDLSAALDELTGDPEIGNSIDLSRVMAAGFSYGGWTALSLGGMTGNLEGIVDACTTHRDAMEACDLLLSDEVSLQTQNPEAWNASYADTRVTHVVSIDPGFVWGLEQENVSSLLTGSVLIGLGGETTRMMATNFEKSGLADVLPDARLVQIDPAFHFTVMPLCTPAGPGILEAEEDDPVCTDPAGTDRAAVHLEILEIISDTLDL